MSKEKKKTENTQTYKIKKKKIKKTRKFPRLRKAIKIIIITLLLLLIIGSGILIGWGYQVLKNAKLGTADMSIKYQNSIVKDKNGTTVATLSGDENREIISLNDMSKYIPTAFVSIEDERFYEHNGVDFKRTAGATLQYFLHGGTSSYGGSTITQQLVKNLTNDKDDTLQRKVTEMARAYYMEKQMSKDQILELYLNLIFLGGQNVCGVQTASKLYFDKDAKDLDLAECAYLAGINHSPNSYYPFSEDGSVADKIKSRTIIVLDKMKQLGKISDDEYNAAAAEVEAGLAFKQGTISQTLYSYGTDAAIKQIISELMKENNWTEDYARLYLYSGGFTIYTTQDPDIQSALEAEMVKPAYQVASLKKSGTTSEAGMCVIDQKTGYVIAVYGKLGAKTGADALGYDRATEALKQTGSSIKPLAVVSPGIDMGVLTAANVFYDTPTTFPGNYKVKDEGAYRGLITLRQALSTSQNVPFVKAMQIVTPTKSIEYLQNFGLKSIDPVQDNNLSLALGGLTHGASPLEMAGAYNAIANGGVYIQPTFYTKILDSDGNVVREAKQETRRVISAAAAFVVTQMLTQPTIDGTATYAAIPGMGVAAKTGTTDSNYDRWFCEFTPYYTASCWFGYDNNEEVRWYSSPNPAGTICSNVMKTINANLEKVKFEANMPEGVVTAKICRDTGLQATSACYNDQRGSRVITEYFVQGTVPSKGCEVHVQVNICSESGGLATEYCPNPVSKVYLKSGMKDKAGYAVPDTEYTMPANLASCPVHTKTSSSSPETPPPSSAPGYPTITLKGNTSMTIQVDDIWNDPRSNCNRYKRWRYNKQNDYIRESGCD